MTPPASVALSPLGDFATTRSSARSGFDLTVSGQRALHYSLIETGRVFATDGPLTSAINTAVGIVLVVVDDAVWLRRSAEIEAYLDEVAPAYRVLVLPGGESNKSLERALQVVGAMDECHTLRRSTPVVAIGGGVVCDIVGFAASIYRRGVPYVRVPTTLLAQVDVSVAIKTGVNHGGFRNRIGAFWPAELTVIDRTFLSSQTVEEVSQGLGEVFKLAVIKSKKLFRLLEAIPKDWSSSWLAHDDLAAQVMRLAVEEMADDLASNLWEDDLARCVDFGHSFSPLIEMRNGQHHGHAVALDCLLSACIAVNRGLLDAEKLHRIVAVMRRCALPIRHPDYVDTELLWESLSETTKHRDGYQHLPMPRAIGKYTFVEDLRREELAPAVRLMRRVTDDSDD